MKRVIVFILITCGISWLAAGLFYLYKFLPYNFFAMIYMLLPAAVAFTLQKWYYKEPIEKPFLISFRLNRWFLVALFLPFLMIAFSIGINILIPSIYISWTGEGFLERMASSASPEVIELAKAQLESFSPLLLAAVTIIPGFFAACTINGLFAFGEELGWRGYMLHYLKDCSFLKASLLIGFVWGIWHFPLILMGHNYPEHSVIGVFLMIVFCIILSPIMVYIVIKSKSVIAAAVFHGSMNAFAGLPLILLSGGNDLSAGFTGYAGFISVLITIVIFFAVDKYISKENIFTKRIIDNFES